MPSTAKLFGAAILNALGKGVEGYGAGYEREKKTQADRAKLYREFALKEAGTPEAIKTWNVVKDMPESEYNKFIATERAKKEMLGYAPMPTGKIQTGGRLRQLADKEASVGLTPGEKAEKQALQGGGTSSGFTLGGSAPKAQ